MTRIDDTGILISSRTATHVQLVLGVDVRFTGADLFQGQTGAAQFKVRCDIWDDDLFINDYITGIFHTMEPESLLELTSVEIPFNLSLAELQSNWSSFEGHIEIFGEFTLMKNGAKLGPSVITRNIVIKLPPVPQPGPLQTFTRTKNCEPQT
jgi:hypothetical protein